MGRDQGTSIRQEGLGGTSRVLSRAERAQRALRYWLEDCSGVDSEGIQGVLVTFDGTGGLGGGPGGFGGRWGWGKLRAQLKRGC